MHRAIFYDQDTGLELSALLLEMRGRHASNPVDRVASLACSLQHPATTLNGTHSPFLPTYDACEEPDQAWERLVACFSQIRPFCKAGCCGNRNNPTTVQLLRLFPIPSSEHWFPSWAQVSAYPDITVRESQIPDTVPPRHERSLRIYSGRIYRHCAFRISATDPTSEVEIDDGVGSRVMAVARDYAGKRCEVQLLSRLPSSLLKEVLASGSSSPLILLDITPCTDAAKPLWLPHLLLVCRELSKFQIPSNRIP